MSECCKFETKDPLNKAPNASFDAIFYALYLNPKKSVTCHRLTGELVLEQENSVSGHIVQKFLECSQRGFPPTLGQIKGRQLDGESMPLSRRTAVYPVDEVLKAMGKKNYISYPSRIRYFLKLAVFVMLMGLGLAFIFKIVPDTLLFLLAVWVTGCCVALFYRSIFHKKNEHYEPDCDCSVDELVKYMASLDPNRYDANSASVELINQARRVLAFNDPNTLGRIEALNSTIDEKNLEIAKLGSSGFYGKVDKIQ